MDTPVADSELQLLFDHLVAGVVVHDPGGRVIAVNPRACELIGLSADQMIGKTLLDPTWQLLYEDGSPMPVADYPVSRVLRHGPPLVNQMVGIVHEAGATVVWVLCNAYTEQAPEDASLRRVVMMLVDVSDRVVAERALAQSEGRYRQLYENSFDGILLTRPDGTVLGANRAACAMLKLDEPTICARGRAGLVDALDARVWELQCTRAEGGGALGRMRMLCGDEQVIEVEVSSAQYERIDGKSACALILRDRTLEKQRLEAMAARSLAEAASRQKSAFVTKVSHELRTPLNAVLGLTTVLRNDAAQRLTAQDQSHLAHIEHAGTHLLRLIEDLLNMSAVESGAMPLQIGDVELAAVARSVVAQIEFLAGLRRIAIDLHAGSAPVLVRADPVRLRQVLWNLLSNAIKYNVEGGRITVAVDHAAANGGGSSGRLSVADTGIGMSPQQVARLFQPFDRLGREDSRVEGAGLGLALAQRLVTAMAGRIEVTSASEQGSDFTVHLPLAEPAATAATKATKATAAGADSAALVVQEPPPVLTTGVAGASAGHTARVQAIRVLYIDDDEVNRIVMSELVRLQGGWSYFEADNGEDGIALARQLRPDLLLVDLMMPGLDGFGVLARVRADPWLADVPCIAVSAHSAPGEVGEALGHGFDGYVSKPVVMPTWLAEIGRVLAVARHGAESAPGLR